MGYQPDLQKAEEKGRLARQKVLGETQDDDQASNAEEIAYYAEIDRQNQQWLKENPIIAKDFDEIETW